MGRIFGQKMQPHAPGWICCLDLRQQLSGRLGIVLLALNEPEIEGFQIERTLDIDPLTPRCGLDRRFAAFGKPAISRA